MVVDAAAGSRFYAFEKSIDSGENWKVINKNPFMDEAGSAEGIIFFQMILVLLEFRGIWTVLSNI